ncbi:hypothetical protein F444_11252 [Plasmopara halstedii]|uniref:F-box protein n=1 Tax=Plasmopara halstedii TaxID=4781 RepID=A0A0P1AK25_PLAHL|nr:hypothetical protein F444_11252 [Plasmopara halstedii]CEG41169.1 hypothetical protein F444_11252 [Plasmopara halstedii]|eukprot:XP_024577538.1 hypothetical protein F444_11252 [Plasmopara halstedii]
MAAAISNAVNVSRTIELLAPTYSEIFQYTTANTLGVPVTLQRTSDNRIQLDFTGINVWKDVTCVKGTHDCRCNSIHFLQMLVMLSEQQILAMNATYVIANEVAILHLCVRVHENAKHGTSLKDFDFVLCHMQANVLEIEQCNEKSRKEARCVALENAKNSLCHVVGCKLHPWKENCESKHKLDLPDVFQSLASQTVVNQMEIRNDRTYISRMNQFRKEIVMTDLPTNVLQTIVCLMNGRDLASLSGVCSLFQHMAYEVVPGLNLVLFEHQRRGLKWMLRRETPSLSCVPQPHPYILSSDLDQESEAAIDYIENKVITHDHVTARDGCGGMFCDEPGLGKTITMLALILRTKGQSTNQSSAQPHGPGREIARSGLRSSRSRGRSVRVEELVSSRASLIVAPDPLVEHWKYQVEAHVAPSALRVFVDPGVEHKLPTNLDLAQYDIVITSFTRLTREWKLHRPTSALEARMPKRYGFEGSNRYADGTLRGTVSSLLTVYWLRVIVDEGHKLGGQTPSDLMQLARLLCAERRWVMTGTPTPNTLQSADLRYMHGLLVFLRNMPYGDPDGQAWVKAIARPFEQNQIIAFYRLQYLLSRIMMRHTKESIRETLPKPIRRTVFIDPTPSEYAQYNGVAAAVRANLVITNMDPDKPGYQHPDSLLNPINRKEALRVVSNLRSACCGGSAVKVKLAEWSRLDTINMLSNLDVDGESMGIVIDYLRKVQLQGMTTLCKCCNRKLQLLMIIPCGHLCCADCVEDQMKRVGPRCFNCNAEFDREAFQMLQPGFEFEMVEAVPQEFMNPNFNQNGRINQNQLLANLDQHHNQQSQVEQERVRNQSNQEENRQNAPRQRRRALDLTRDIHFIDASKALYAATRVKELKEEYIRRGREQSSCYSHRQARHRDLKVIIFSQFKDHIWHTKVAFAQQGVPTADFIAGLSPGARMKQLTRFRKDPNVHVLLLTEVGSHGLDLSFVTHIFLMDEIWDKSLEQQVISRAHRMGATQAVVVEQLWMRGSVESQMFQPHRSEQNQVQEEVEPGIVASMKAQVDGYPAKLLKNLSSGGGSMFHASSKKRKRHRTHGDTRMAAASNKNTFLQRKLDYVLNNLRLLGEAIVAEPGQVRFFVEDDHKNVILQAIRVIPNRETSSTVNAQLSTSNLATVNPLPTVEASAQSRLDVQRAISSEDRPVHQPFVNANKHNVLTDPSIRKECEDGDSRTAELNNQAAKVKQTDERRLAEKKRCIKIVDPQSEILSPQVERIRFKRDLESNVKSKKKAVSFIVIDDSDSDSE